MADFAGIALDANVAESDGEFTVLPAGKYKAATVDADLADNKAGTGKILKMSYQVMEGPYTGEKITDNINITNPSAQCQAIGQGTLKRICGMCNVVYPPQNTDGLMGKPMVITVGVEEFTSNNTGKKLKSNKIKKYEPANTAIPANVAQMPQAQTQPTQTQASGW